MSIDETLAQIGAYVDVRRMRRDEANAAAVNRLTDRELLLVREAAVMGFVQGARGGPYREGEFPKDHEIMRRVLDGMQSFPDLYPTFATLYEETDET